MLWLCGIRLAKSGRARRSLAVAMKGAGGFDMLGVYE